MYKQLIREQRYAISLGLKEGKTQKEIAQQIGVSPSTISRELKRNSNKRGKYCYALADEMAHERREHLPGNRRIPSSLIKKSMDLIKKEEWSPKQISGYMKLQGKQISCEKIYQLIRSDESGELASHCRHKMKYRRHKSSSASAKASNISNRTSIHERPAEADGKRFGDWEMDLIIGKDGEGAILTLTERSTNFLIMEKLKEGKKAAPLARVVTRLLYPYRGEALKTLTTDNGSEFACHEQIARSLKTTVYFADPYSSWQKGAIENMNKLIRQYIPKKTDFDTVSDRFILEIRKKINRRPREKLGFQCPRDCFFRQVNKKRGIP